MGLLRLRHRSVKASRRLGLAAAFLLGLPGSLDSQQLPDGWTLSEVGSPPLTQGATFAELCLDIALQGGGPGELEDHLVFLHTDLPGDGGLEARFETLRGQRPSAQVALQMRESLEPTSQYVAAALDRVTLWQPFLYFREASGGPADFVRRPDPDARELPSPPHAFLRLERRGSTFTGYDSRDGQLWTHIAEHTIPVRVTDDLLAGVTFASPKSQLEARTCDIRLTKATDRLPNPRWSTTPTSGILGEQVTFDATASVPGLGRIVSFHWALDLDATAEGPVVSHTFTRISEPFITLTVTDESGRSVRRLEPFLVLKPPRPVGDWRAIELYGASRADYTLAAGCIAIEAPGIDFVATVDTSALLYREATGDVIMRGRVSELAGGLRGASVGLMIRESFDPRSRYALVMLTTLPGDLTFAYATRPAWGALEDVRLTTGIGVPLPQLPDAWLGIERSGNELIGTISPDGSEWFEIGRLGFDPPLEEKTLAAIAVTSQCGHALGCPTPLAATFCDVTIEGGEIETSPRFLRGDIDASGRVNIGDAIILYNHLFRGGAPGPCEDAADSNDDGTINLSDAATLVNFLFRGGPPPAAPGVTCGPDADEADELLACGVTGCP